MLTRNGKLTDADESRHHCGGEKPDEQTAENHNKQMDQEKNGNISKIYDATNLLLNKWNLLERRPVLLLAKRTRDGFQAEVFCPWETDSEGVKEAFDILKMIYESVLNELPQQLACKEEVLTEQQLWKQEKNSSLDQEEPESIQIKEDQEKICTSHEGEQLEVKREADTLILTPDNEEKDHMKPEPDSDQQLLSHSSAVAESPDQTGSNHVDQNITEHKEDMVLQHRLFHMKWNPVIKLRRIELSQQLVYKEDNKESDHTEPEPDSDQQLLSNSSAVAESPDQTGSNRVDQNITEHKEDVDLQHRLFHMKWSPVIKLHRTELPQQLVCTEEEFLTEQQLWNQERNSSLDQEEPESLQIKEEQEKICTSHEEQLEVKREDDTLMLTPDNEESDHMEPEPDSDQQLLSHSSAVAESQDQTGSNHVDSVSYRNAEPQEINKNKIENCHTSKTDSESHTGKKSFKCDLCGKNFALKSQFLQHMRVHTGEKLFPCTVCAKVFKVKYKLLRHMRTHTGEKPYSCQTCGKCFIVRWSLTVHERSHTGEKPYPCKICGKCFSQSSSLRCHEKCHTFEEQFSCKTCGKCFLKRSGLRDHERTHTGEKPFSCKICGKCFSCYSSFTVHERSCSGEKPYLCKTCGKCFLHNSVLRIHERTHTGEKPFSCKTCGKCFSQRAGLRCHERIHTGEKPFCCKICGKCFACYSSFTVHERSHSGEKSYLCTTCGKCFLHKSVLRAHEKTHTGVKPFSCKTCGKCFSRRSGLRCHERTHTGEKPFSCKICGKYFTYHSSCTVHERSHTGEKQFSCKTCGKCFSQRSGLRDHERTHTGEKPFSCKICGKCFSHRSNIRSHERCHTVEEPFSL